MSLRARVQMLRSDERGFAIILAVALMSLVTIASLTIMTLAQGEDSHSRRDQKIDSAYQAAEAGTDAYLSDLTESNIFWSAYMAKGEATRTDSGNVAHPNDCTTTIDSCPDLAWSSGSTWTYKTARASDKGWWTLGTTTQNTYQYLIQVYPPNGALSGIAQVLTRIDVTGRPSGDTNVADWRTIETIIRPSALSDFQAFLATSITYGTDATTTGPIFVGEDNSGTPGNLTHNGIAQANLYAEGNVTVGGTLQNGAQKYDKNTSPTALCKLNNCATVPFSNFANTFTTLSQAASAGGGIVLATTDPIERGAQRPEL